MRTAPDSSPRPLLPGYDVLDLLGEGATGAVWSVRGPDGIRWAAKVFAADTDQLDYEVSVLQSLRHDHVVRLHDVIEDRSSDRPGTALLMELAEGGSLADALARRDVLTPGELVTVLCPIARALHDLHGLGLVHGDLSPGNILLTHDGKPLIADLGMSRLAGHVGDEVWATELWAAPEVLAGSGPVPASDVYSLGAIAWRALTGVDPEPAALRPDLAELAPELAPELRDLVNSALAHTDSARPLPGEFAIALWQCAAPEPAPVQGSPARRTAVPAREGDDAHALTRRIRAQAAAEAQAPARVETRRSRRAARGRGRWVLGGAAVAGVVAMSVLALGFGGGGSGDARAAGGATSSVAAVSPRTPGGSASTGTAPALAGHEVAVLQRLASARAKAWVGGDRAHLTDVEVAGSPAYTRDAADLGAVAARHASYAGLSFSVRSATVREERGGVVHVTALIDRSAYDVVTSTGRHTVPAARGQRTDLSVRWTKNGWRVVDWASST